MRREDGFTLPELLMAMTIGIVVLFAAFTVIERTSSVSMTVTDRQEALQQGRVAMQRITQELRSQVCLTSTVAPITNGQDSSITFTADMSDGSVNPQQRRLTYDATAKTITEYVSAGVGTPPALTFPSVTRTQVLATNVQQVPGVPVFRYYKYTTSAPIRPTVLLATPLSAADALSTAMVSVSFVVVPSRTKSTTVGTTFQDDVKVRAIDPSNPTAVPRCV